ncbi:uncharacterized protein A1O9_07726 [Exophiala aquamarina CBS 119918]|uniref:Ornithine aminotransferase n=1 Tax=Exophiala aquamarina CBS 119918 TaxID=1182545 RepID=A0A072PKV5_9EURO|nr:uncharacterized protein A1O9_07726 [Exophiala aquamarina CBS 119918]KEF56145.1 hypothetical protein A1O9_07726 [Exophiala aquamarina CBS 119918]
MSVGGMIVPSKKYVQALREWCKQTGTLMIIDEAQSGIGRTGKRFAIKHIDSSSHTNDPFLAAVGLANIEIIECEGLVQNAGKIGRYLKDAFEKIKVKHEGFGDVRGLGLMIGLEIVVDKVSKGPSSEHASAISQYCRDHGLLLEKD